MKNGCPKKRVTNNPVLVSACLMRSVYQIQYSSLQEVFVKFMAMWCRNCYNRENISKILRRLKVNGGGFILRQYSGEYSSKILRQLKKMRIILY